MQILNKSYPLSELAERVGGRAVGDLTLSISGLCSLEAPQPNKITFIRSTSAESCQRILSDLPHTTAVIVSENVGHSLGAINGISAIVTKESYAAFLNLIPLFYQERRPAPGVHPTAAVDPTAKIHPEASIGAFCSIGAHCSVGKGSVLYQSVRLSDDVSIGESGTIHSGVSIREGTSIGDRVVIHDNAVIGADGFGYTPDPKGGLRKVPQVGNVVIESDVEIGANTCIDRGAFGSTVVGAGTKIDNLVQIGHNVVIGTSCIICGGSGLAGSIKLGAGVVVGGRVGIADHVEVSSGVRIGGGSGVTTSLTEPGDYLGYPAVKASEWRRIQVHLRRLVGPKK